jgi:hypothetical protein
MPTVAEAIKRFDGVKGHVAVAIWQEEDVLERAKALRVKITHEEAGKILDLIDLKQDCELGINWTTLDIFIQDYRPIYSQEQVEERG